jgi:ankyrin repeat protein
MALTTVVVDLLLRYKAGPNVRTNVGKTPLHLAARAGYLDMVEALLAGGATVDAGERGGKTAMRLASEAHRADVAAFQQQHGGHE